MMSWKVCMWKVLRHFCNDLILRDCEMPVSCFMRYALYHACHAICLVLCFSCEKPVLYEGLAIGHI